MALLPRRGRCWRNTSASRWSGCASLLLAMRGLIDSDGWQWKVGKGAKLLRGVREPGLFAWRSLSVGRAPRLTFRTRTRGLRHHSPQTPVSSPAAQRFKTWVFGICLRVASDWRKRARVRTQRRVGRRSAADHQRWRRRPARLRSGRRGRSWISRWGSSTRTSARCSCSSGSNSRWPRWPRRWVARCRRRTRGCCAAPEVHRVLARSARRGALMSDTQGTSSRRRGAPAGAGRAVLQKRRNR